MSDMWMPPQTTRPPLRTAFSAAGTSAPTGAKIMAASSRSRGARSQPPPPPPPGRKNRGGVEPFRRRLFRAARPHRAERACEVLCGGVALAREGEHAPALPDRDLRQDMGGGAEAVEAERLAFAGHAIAAPADQAGA